MHGVQCLLCYTRRNVEAMKGDVGMSRHEKEREQEYA